MFGIKMSDFPHKKKTFFNFKKKAYQEMKNNFFLEDFLLEPASKPPTNPSRTTRTWERCQGAQIT